MSALVTDTLVDIANNVQEHVMNPDQPLFYNKMAREYEQRISPLWHFFLTMPSFEVMLESNVPLCGIQRTVPSVINRVQAKEWMPPLSDDDREVHKKAQAELEKEQADEIALPEHRKQYGENDPLPLEYWVPSVFKEEQGLQKYQDHMNHVDPYLGPL